MLQPRSTVAHKGQKESPVQAIEREIRRGEHGSKMTMRAIPNLPLNDGNPIPQLGCQFSLIMTMRDRRPDLIP
jgi:hypothetical protein